MYLSISGLVYRVSAADVILSYQHAYVNDRLSHSSVLSKAAHTVCQRHTTAVLARSIDVCHLPMLFSEKTVFIQHKQIPPTTLLN